MSVGPNIERIRLWQALYVLIASLFPALSNAQIGPPPLITFQPESLSLLFGSTASFSVSAVSATKLSYQWSLNGVKIPSGHYSTLTVNNISFLDAGIYTVTVNNASGSATSLPALLTVLLPPSPLIIVPGGMTTNGFQMTLSGPAGYNYVIFASSDLLDWRPISTNAAPAGIVVFTDTSAPKRSARYYSAKIVQ